MKPHSRSSVEPDSPSPVASQDAQAAWIRAAMERYEAPLMQYAARLMHRDVDGARDIVQDTFLKLWTANRSDVDGHLAQWLYRVCRNRALDVCRKDARMTTLTDFHIDHREAASGSKLTSETPGETGSVLSMLESLPEKQQEVIRLKFQGGLSYAEIANVMDITANHVGVLIHNGLKALREKFGGSVAGAGATRQVIPQINAGTAR